MSTKSSSSTPLQGTFAFLTVVWDGGAERAMEPVAVYDDASLLGLSIETPGVAPTQGVGVMPVGASGALLVSGAQTTNGNSSTPLSTITFREALLFLNISAVSVAGGSLQVFIQSQDPVSANWTDIADFGQIGYDGTNLIVNQEAIPLNTPFLLSLGAHPSAKALTGANIRVRWEVSGASFTFSVGYAAK